MARIYNSDLFKELTEGGRIQTSKDVIPQLLAEKIVPVMEVNPKLLRRSTECKFLSKSTSGAGTIFTTPTDRDFIITGYTLSVSKDAACDQATGPAALLQVVINGAALGLAYIAGTTLTANSQTITQSFMQGIKVDRGSAITLAGGTFTAGSCHRIVSVQGYFVDNANS